MRPSKVTVVFSKSAPMQNGNLTAGDMSTLNRTVTLNLLVVQAKNIKNKPIINRDPHSIRFEEMQCEIKALREELQKQRMSLMTATHQDYDVRRLIEDQGQIKQLEDKVIA